MAPFETLWQGPNLQIDFLDGQGRDLVIAFSSIGHDPTRMPAPEFVGTATGRGTGRPTRRALFVRDQGRSWGNDPDFATALQFALAQVQALAPVSRILAMGLSMGGYAALVAARIIPVDVVLAFGPQASLLPDAVQGETRWRDWTANLQTPLWPHAPLPPAGCWGIICHGAQDDLAQAQGFAQAKGCDHLIFPDQSHSGLVPHLKSRGVLAGLVQAALEGDRRRLLRIAGSAGGVQRRRLDRS